MVCVNSTLGMQCQIGNCCLSATISETQIRLNKHHINIFLDADSYNPLYYMVQYTEDYGPWICQQDHVDPSVTAYTVENLSPFSVLEVISISSHGVI